MSAPLTGYDVALSAEANLRKAVDLAQDAFDNGTDVRPAAEARDWAMAQALVSIALSLAGVGR